MYELIDGTGMDNRVWHIIKKDVPTFLHCCASNLDVVIKGVIQLSNVHHESCDKSTIPDMRIDLLQKVLSLEPFAAICHFGFLFVQ